VRNKELEEDKTAREALIRLTRRKNKERRVTPTRRSGSDRRVLGENIPGLHINKSIERFGGNVETFLHVLRSFAANTPPILDKMENVMQDTLAPYAILAHGIKGSSRGICAEIVGDKAEALEKAAKSGDFDFVRVKNPPFLEVVRQLVTDIEKLLAKMTVNRAAKPQKDKPDGETLKNLLIACKNNDMDDMDEAMSQLESYEYRSDDGLMAWLKQNVAQMNLTEIQEKLSTLPQ
jgi:HPt (histidine-containing phosphotransfer) domain-containing protein